MLVVAAAFTSFYSWRLMFMTFYGKPKGDTHAYDHAHESPMVMLIPLGVLSLGATFAGMIWYNSFFGNEAVSYTHLDVYKRQRKSCSRTANVGKPRLPATWNLMPLTADWTA